MVGLIGSRNGTNGVRKRLILGSSSVSTSADLLVHVSFAPKLIQDSPAKKSSPRETIFAGDFACELNPCLDFSSRRAQDSNSKNSANAIPIKVLFDRPKS
jgi:hypothetical protein